jgi:NTE family protein
MATRNRRTPIDLALQGGGSHGAFTWGVLDALLEDESLVLDGICGTSAGALNAAVLATGFERGAAAGARKALREFWLDIAGTASCFGLHTPAAGRSLPWNGLAGYNLDANPFFNMLDQWLRLFSPQQLNPLGLNPLRDVVSRHVDERAIRQGPVKLFVVATTVATGQPEVFTGKRLGVDALMASACLPQLFKAVTIDGVAYWDGGYSGNPALWPLIYDTRATDVVLVKINPLVRQGVPTTVNEIDDRLNEITFNAGLVGEMRAIHFVQELLEQQRIDPRRYKNLRLHMVADDEALAPLDASSKLNTDRNFLLELHRLGRAAGQRWLQSGRKQVGRGSSLDIEATFLAPRSARPQGRRPV